jgi:rhodanese-related sulfurtransferase
MMIDVRDLAADRAVRVFDIRPHAERYGGMGFVPGSVGVDPDVEALLAAAAATPSHERVALVCLSGRRSGLAARELELASGREIVNVAGGILAWRAAGLPTSGVTVQLDPGDPMFAQVRLDEVPRLLAACFVAEVANVTDDEIDPLEVLQHCFAQAGTRWDQPDVAGLYRVLELAGAEAWRIGNDLHRIAANLDRFLALLRRLEGPGPSSADPPLDEPTEG